MIRIRGLNTKMAVVLLTALVDLKIEFDMLDGESDNMIDFRIKQPHYVRISALDRMVLLILDNGEEHKAVFLDRKDFNAIVIE